MRNRVVMYDSKPRVVFRYELIEYVCTSTSRAAAVTCGSQCNVHSTISAGLLVLIHNNWQKFTGSNKEHLWEFISVMLHREWTWDTASVFSGMSPLLVISFPFYDPFFMSVLIRASHKLDFSPVILPDVIANYTVYSIWQWPTYSVTIRRQKYLIIFPYLLKRFHLVLIVRKVNSWHFSITSRLWADLSVWYGTSRLPHRIMVTEAVYRDAIFGGWQGVSPAASHVTISSWPFLRGNKRKNRSPNPFAKKLPKMSGLVLPTHLQ